MKLLDGLPGLRLLLQYDRKNLAQDLITGVVVTLVLIPSAIAYADLAKCPPIAGLYAALAGMVAYALFTSSKHVIVGPDAAVAIMVGAAIGPLSDSDPGKAIAVSSWLALLVGLILVLAAWLRLGSASDFLSSPVMLGFMNGAAVVIIASQLGKLCNLRLKEDNTLLRLYESTRGLHGAHQGDTQQPMSNANYLKRPLFSMRRKRRAPWYPKSGGTSKTTPGPFPNRPCKWVRTCEETRRRGCNPVSRVHLYANDRHVAPQIKPRPYQRGMCIAGLLVGE